MVRKILLPTDGSEPASFAEEWLLDTFDPDRHAIVILSVADDAVVEHLTESVDYDETDEVRKHLQPDLQEMTTELKNRFEDVGFSVETIVKIGTPGPIICRTAREENVDEIVMGRRGQGQYRELLLGSVSHYVLHHSRCPVTVISESPRETENG